jgi:acrylyl-CoA reductase (NADPH)
MTSPASVPDTFRAFVAERHDDRVDRGVRELAPADLGAGDVVVRVAYSSANYKDGLATVPDGRVARVSPLVPGIDLAGEIVEGGEDLGGPGTLVLAHGYELGVAHHGGFAEYARVPAGWVVPLPEDLDPRQAMAIGTAGFTAALSLHQLEQRGLRVGDGPVLVTGAAGGVGSSAVGMLANRGYEVVASSGKADAADWLRGRGAAEVVGREEAVGDAGRPLERERWAAAIDCVGGATLAGILRSLRYGAAVAASGNAGGAQLSTTVLPFILRGVALLGVDSAQCDIGLRRELWRRLAGELRPPGLDDAHEVGLDELEPTLDALLAGGGRGRTVVRLLGR